MVDSSPRFEIVEHTADVGIRGFAPTLPGLFAVMAEGLFSIITDPGRVEPVRNRSVTLAAESIEDLLHDWLDELNQLHQVHGEVYGSFAVTLNGLELTGVVRGEPIDFGRHDLRMEVKAVTWHELVVRESDRGTEAFVLLDI